MESEPKTFPVTLEVNPRTSLLFTWAGVILMCAYIAAWVIAGATVGAWEVFRTLLVPGFLVIMYLPEYLAARAQRSLWRAARQQKEDERQQSRCDARGEQDKRMQKKVDTLRRKTNITIPELCRSIAVKSCRKCFTLLPIKDGFYENSKVKGGYRNICKACTQSYGAAYRALKKKELEELQALAGKGDAV